MLTKKIVKRGDSHFILIPKNLLDMIELKLGDKVEMIIEGRKIIISPIEKEKEV